MTDLEITKACAEMIGYPEYVNPDGRATKPVPPRILVLLMDQNATPELYDPLHDDAQCFALVKKFNLMLLWLEPQQLWSINFGVTRNQDLNRAICECVAKMHANRS